MPLPSLLLTIRGMMVAIAATGLLLGGFMMTTNLLYYNNGPHESLLSVGQSVLTFGEDDQAVPHFENSTGKSAIPSGTRCLVVTEPARDEDDCSGGGRQIRVKINDGNRKGEELLIARKYLRVR